MTDFLSLSSLEYDTEAADVGEELVLIRLESEFESYRLRDTFIWNLNGPSHCSGRA